MPGANFCEIMTCYEALWTCVIVNKLYKRRQATLAVISLIHGEFALLFTFMYFPL